MSEAFVLARYNEDDRQLCNVCVRRMPSKHLRCVRNYIIRNIVVRTMYFTLLLLSILKCFACRLVRFGSVRLGRDTTTECILRNVQ